MSEASTKPLDPHSLERLTVRLQEALGYQSESHLTAEVVA